MTNQVSKIIKSVESAKIKMLKWQKFDIKSIMAITLLINSSLIAALDLFLFVNFAL